MLTHRQIAKRKTVIWQVGAVAVLIAAGAALAFPQVRKFLAPSPQPIDTKPVAAETKPASSADHKTPPLAEAIHSLGLVTAWTKPPETPTPTIDPVGVGVAPPPPPLATDWIYAGSFITSRSRAALVKIDAAQQVIALNAVVNDTKLITIEPTYIEIERGGVTKQIELASRPALNMPTDSPKKPVAFRTAPSLPGGGAAAGMNIPSMAHMAQPPPQTFSQARDIAAREAAARAANPQQPPPMQPVVELDGQKYEAPMREEAIKHLMEPDQPQEVRSRYLEAIGIKPGMPVETSTAIMQKMGLDPTSDAGRHIMETLKANENPAPKETK